MCILLPASLEKAVRGGLDLENYPDTRKTMYSEEWPLAVA